VAVTKLSLSLDEAIAETAKQAAHDEGLTVSAWFAAAATARIRNRLLGEAIADAAAGLGAFDADTIDALAASARAQAIFTGTAPR
jgi:hypothetical protein